MEADLQAHYGIDYRDRWRGDLTLRRIYVLIKHLPPESHCASLSRDGRPHWPITAHVLDDLRIAMTSTKDHPTKPYPTRFPPKRVSGQLRRKIQDGRRRRRDRQAQIDAGEIT